MQRLAGVLLLAALQLGCATSSLLKSRWAMEDPVYADKYQDGAQRYDLPGKTKQALDARHLAGHHGYFLGGGYQSDPGAIAGEVGIFAHPSHWLTTRGSLMGITDTLDENAFGGLNLGVRAQTPSRLAPFVGLGVFSGVSRSLQDATNDGLDNDGDIFVDEPGEQETQFDGWRSSIYPEVGVHAWLTRRIRLSTSASYQITTEGRDYDYWLFSLNLAFLAKRSKAFPDAYDSVW